jgi:hypothetical protein
VFVNNGNGAVRNTDETEMRPRGTEAGAGCRIYTSWSPRYQGLSGCIAVPFGRDMFRNLCMDFIHDRCYCQVYFEHIPHKIERAPPIGHALQ